MLRATRRLPLLAACLLLPVACQGKDGVQAVATVGSQKITSTELQATVEHFREEAKREGHLFPAAGSARFRTVRSALLGLLVYRSELAQEAQRLQVRVTDQEVERRVAQSGAEGGGADRQGEQFTRESVRAQLEYEGIFRVVARGVRGRSPALLGARRNRAMARFLARMRRAYRVRYEPDYAPGS